MSIPKVSVCMVTYNQERYIAQAVQSALDQVTDFPIEIVIGEDCSTDSTRAIVLAMANDHPEKIRLLLDDHNLGAKPNFMRTFWACRGEYVAMLEGDDYWTNPDKLQRQVQALDARPDWAMCFHPAQIVYDDWQKPPGVWPEKWDKDEATLVDLFDQDFIPTNAVVFRNRLFDKFPPWYADLFVGDWPLHILNAEHGNIGFLPEVMSVYRVHATGAWSTMDRCVQLGHLLKLLTAVDRHFGGKFSEPIDRCRCHVLNAAIDERDAARRALAQMVDEVRAMRNAHKEMLQAHQEWTRSIPYRVVRETLRPYHQLRERIRQRAAAREAAAAPAPEDASKAA